MASNDTFIGFVIGVALGAGGYALFLGQQPEPKSEIQSSCSAAANEYECSFFNRGKGLGGMCVQVVLVRTQEPSKYVKTSGEKSIQGSQVCSGALTQGQDSRVTGKGFYAAGIGTNASDFCSIKGSSSLWAGCEMDIKLVAQTR
jgi:hypothetical protein